jgi:hypothetical protein
MLSNEPKNVPIRPFPPKLPILAVDSLPLYAYTDALLKVTDLHFQLVVVTKLPLIKTDSMMRYIAKDARTENC